jgi:hypothetical protein
MVQAVQSVYLPQKIVVLKNTRHPSAKLRQLLPFIKHHSTISGKPAVYICENNYCQLPLTGIRALKNKLAELQKNKLPDF